MKKTNLRKMTALAAAFVLAAQYSTFMTYAEETALDKKVDIDEEIYASIIKNNSSYDKNKDGVLSEEELQSLYYITLDGTIIKNLSSLEDLNKYPGIDAILIKDWTDFDVSLIKELKYVKALELHNCTLGECSEEIDHIYNVTVYYSEELDLNRLKAFSNLQSLGVINTKLTNVSALEAIDLKLLARDTTEDNSELLKYIKCSDIVMPEGFLYPVTVRPAGIMKGKLTVTDPDVVKLTDNTIRTFSDKADEKLPNYIYAEKAGETEYQYSDMDGNQICTGKIKVIENKPVDEPLDAENKIGVRIISGRSFYLNGTEEKWAYLLYDSGILYSYNKEGKGELALADENVSNLTKDCYGNNIVLYKDGTLKINGQNITEKYKVVTASDDLAYILCSDGVLRRITSVSIVSGSGSGGGLILLGNLGKYNADAETGDYTLLLEDIKENIKSMCSSHPEIVQTKDGKTALIYFETNDGKQEYKFLDLDLNINPKSCVSVQDPVALGTGWSSKSDVYYVVDDKNDLYQINITGYNSSKEKTKTVSSSLIASDVTRCGYLYRRGEGTNQKSDIAYTDKDGKAYSCTDAGKEIKAENGFDLFSNKQSNYGKIDTHYSFTDNITESGTKVINDGTDLGISIHTDDGTENFTCLDRFASFTHVKESTGTFFDGSDYTILITREDNTLWKYSIEAGTFTRLDDQIKKGNPEENPPKEEPEKKYNTKDIVSVMQYIFGAENAVKEDWMDFDGNGKVNIIDLLLLKKEILHSFH